ncbi:MAG: hypothetical protein CSA62_07625 [Planctomycetota bacterium]|nr:MAG: hypothetical protein CSA62_07625 [Planctomycetota bacterium]
MEASSDVLASLEARAEERSLADLEKRGKKTLRVIRKREIAALLQEAVERAVEKTGLVPPEQVEELRERSQKEFADLKEEWQNERCEHAKLEARVQEEQERAQELEEVASSLREELDEAQQRIGELEAQVSAQQQAPVAAAQESAAAQEAPSFAGGGDSASAMLMMKMMEEIQTLKAQAQGTQASAAAPAPADDGLASKLDQLVSGLDKKLESFGKKMGISAAVDNAEVDYSGLFEKDGASNVETNMGDVEVEKRKGGGIAANLERMKKLRGG